jgi:hypothetical protein
MDTTLEIPASEILNREIARFVESVRKRSDVDHDRRRRARKRYHRSWPMLVAMANENNAYEHPVALHNGSELGVAFLTSLPIAPGRIIYLRLFWHDDCSPRVPAVVRHSTAVAAGYLVGCEFAFGSAAAN